jgi:phage terminase small subunit
MAGVKGKSGGYRAGSGPKQKPADLANERDPLAFLLDVMQGKVEANPTQLKAAIAAAQYVHTKTHDGGKKEEVLKRAREVAAGRFAPKEPPKLVVNNE